MGSPVAVLGQAEKEPLGAQSSHALLVLGQLCTSVPGISPRPWASVCSRALAGWGGYSVELQVWKPQAGWLPRVAVEQVGPRKEGLADSLRTQDDVTWP